MLLLLGCTADPIPLAPGDSDVATDTTDTGPDTAPDSASDSNPDTAPDTDTGPIAPQVLGVEPWLGDPDGGGGRVVVEVSDSAGLDGATFGGVPLTDFAVDDATHVSGVPGAHEPGVVDVIVTGAASGEGAGLFEYWSPAQLDGLDAYFDAGRGVTEEAGAVSAWLDQGPAGHTLAQADASLRPRWVADAFGASGGLRFSGDAWLRLAEASPLPEGRSTFAVARWTATDTATPASSANAPLTLLGDHTNGYGSFGASGGAVASVHYVGGHVTVTRGEGLHDGAARLVGASVDPATVVKLYVGAEQVGLDGNSAPVIGLGTWDTVGAGANGLDGWEGDVGALVVVAGELARDDRLRLDEWAQQRFGTPDTAPLDEWTRITLGEMPEAWAARDGAQMVELASGRILALGGWSPYDPWGSRTTNEVWASDDQGETWTLLLAHDDDPPREGDGARFPPGHTVGVTTWQGHAVVIGTDPNQPPYTGDVWVEGDDGATWTLVSEDAPTAGRCLFLAASLGDDLYVMGGQTNEYDTATGIADVWRSTDGGVTWEELDAPPWAPRGMVYRPVERDGRLVLVGGGLYDDTDPVVFNGVYTFDGEAWTEVLPDGHTQFDPAYYLPMAEAAGRLWVFNGHDGVEEFGRALFSDDGGATWAELPGGAGGATSHADAVVGLADRVIRVSGNLSERRVYAFVHGG